MFPRPALVAFALLAGCNPLPRRLELAYPPLAEEIRAAPIPAAAPLAERTVGLELFRDDRTFPEVGEVRGSSGRQTGWLESAEPLPLWVRRGLAFELERVGIPSVERESVDDTPLRLEGRVDEAYVVQHERSEARVSFHAFLRCTAHGELLLSRTYSGAVSRAVDAEGGPEESLCEAFSQAARDLARDVAAAPACSR